MDKLQFDAMKVNTNLAKEYFQKNNYQFPCKRDSSYTGESEKDEYSNTIFYNCWTTKADFELRCKGDELRLKLKELGEAVEKNAETLCQIEYLIRKIPIEDVRKYDIKLMVQCFYSNTSPISPRDVASVLETGWIHMGKNTPLYHLGLVALALKTLKKVHITATKETAAASHLFVDLCNSVGLNNIALRFTKEYHPTFPHNTELSGCVGVVTDSADVDSAVDVFLSATTWYPWKLRRVLVQESVYDSFKKALSWKAGLKPAPNPRPSEPRCADTVACGAQTFLVDFAGDSGAARDGIVLEAYRTTKELMSLVRSRTFHFMSLWAGDVSQANEMACDVPAAFVWINDYGTFDGPPRASAAIYTQMFKVPCIPSLVDSPETLERKQEAWAATPFEERRRLIEDVVDDVATSGQEEKSSFKALSAALVRLNSDSDVQISKDRMLVALAVPHKFILVDRREELDFDELAMLLTGGSALIFDFPSASKYKRLSSIVPIEFPVESGKGVKCFWPETLFKRFKLIWTNYGTIFAN